MKKIIFILCVLLFSSPWGRIGGAFAQWQPDVRLTNNPGNSYAAYNNARSIASSGNDVHVVWWDSRDGNWEIYYKGSMDGGLNWGTDTRLTHNSATSVTPSVTVSGFDVHVVWWDDRDGNGEIYYKRSIDGGINWGTDTRLTHDSSESRNPSVSAYGLNVHVVWQDVDNTGSGAIDIYYKRSTDRGESWQSVKRLTYDSTASSPSVSVSGSFVHVVWFDERDGNREIYYKRSSDGGISWGAGMRLTNNSADSEAPSVSVFGMSVHVVWMENRDGNEEIYYKRSVNGGSDWGTDIQLTNNSASSGDPSISVSDSVVHVVWRDNRDGNPEMYYKRSMFGGESWEPDTRLTYNSASSSRPSFSGFDSLLHVVWYDNRDGNNEIYYKRNPAGTVTSIENIDLEFPEAYHLEQNYPNPFNPSTVISYQLPLSSHVILKVYDLLGNEIATLVNEEKPAGTYEVMFNLESSIRYPASGIYFYKLIADEFVQTKKMILLK